MRQLAHLVLVLVLGSSIGCCCLSRGGGCGPCNSGAYGSYYGGGNSCPNGNCNLQGAYYDGFGGVQSASIPGALPATAAAPGTFPVTASAPIVVQPTATASAPLSTY